MGVPCGLEPERHLRFIYQPGLRKGTGVWGFKEKEGNALQDEKQDIGKQMFALPCKQVFQMKTSFLVIALFLLQAPYLNYFR